ncbi:BSD domain-containing protein 1 [Cynara cardunculus var. scolymus]|uniref:BSD domain-containing protein 1 n=1 Tax=Cynara cardunculus var. scolymus TaxID=59895 RepID=UPI000D629411|nr:BSD domain-containing protein 1 [Cynara cardunculus var. scolymus]
MNFFKSMLSDDTEPENMDGHGNSDTDRRPNQSPKHQEIGRAEEEFTDLNLTSSAEVVGVGGGGGGGGGGGLWSFGDLVKTITTRSESVLETYRRDLKEFGSGLRKESDLFREVASRAVKELPSSIEVGASAIDGVLKSTADIISQGKEALLEPSDFDDSDASESAQNRSGLNSRGYSRFESQLNAIQTDARTYCVDPEDIDDYSNWKLGFLLDDKESEIEKLIGDNGSIEAIYRKLVPNEVDDGSFWSRYFYRVHKLKQQEDMRANLVRRSLTADDEEELSWDVDDEDEDEDEDEEEKESNQNPIHESEAVSSNVADDDLEKNPNSAIVNNNTAESMPKSNEDLDHSENVVDKDLEKNTDAAIVDKNNADDSKPSSRDLPNETVESVPKTKENQGSSSHEEEDIEWDEIEDLGEHDEKRVSQGDSLKNGGDLFKQLNVAEDDEDLSWDIEDDDDEPGKTGK